jgi:hypothetical protein
MVKTYHIDKAIKLDFEDRWICPECINHKQGDLDKFYDCKNVFVDDDGQAVGQCCCYSEAHGNRD